MKKILFFGVALVIAMTASAQEITSQFFICNACRSLAGLVCR